MGRRRRFIGSALLDAYDCVGDPVSARASMDADEAVDLHFMARARPMLAGAAADLCQRAGLTLAELALDRVFIVTPESAAPLGALWMQQAWLSLHGLAAEREQQALLQRLSIHDSVFEALSAASAWLAMADSTKNSNAGALLLCCESWLTHEALARLDDADLLCSPSCDGVVPGEASVLLRLQTGAPLLHCTDAVEAEDRHGNERPLGTAISEALLTLGTGREADFAATVLVDAHSNLRAMARESEFLRRRHWPTLPPEGPSWFNGAVLGYVGHCMPLLQMAALASWPASNLPAVAYARSLWRQALVSAFGRKPAGSEHVDKP